MNSPRLCIVVALLVMAFGSVLSNAGAPVADPQEWLRRRTASEAEGLGRIIARMIVSYDLTAKVEETLKKISTDEDLVAFLRKKGLDPDNLTKTQEDELPRHMVAYCRITQKLPEEGIAWFSLMTSGPDAPWRASFSDYQSLAKKRPDDLPPKLLMLSHTLTNQTDCEEWLLMLKSAHASTTSEEQRACCFIAAIRSTLESLGTNEFASQTVDQLKRWTVEQNKSETSTQLLKKIEALRLALAVVRGTPSEVADLARYTPLRSMRPMFYLLSMEPERARQALVELKALTDLSPDEKKTLEAAERMLDKRPDSKPAVPVK